MGNLIFTTNGSYTLDEIRQKFGVENIIRIHSEEWNGVPKRGYFQHFNLSPAPNHPDRYYLLTRIVGRLPGGQPILDIGSGSKIAFGVGHESNVMRPESYSGSMIHIQSDDELADTLVWRYSQSRPWMSDDEIANHPVDITYLEIVND